MHVSSLCSFINILARTMKFYSFVTKKKKEFTVHTLVTNYASPYYDNPNFPYTFCCDVNIPVILAIATKANQRNLVFEIKN